MYNCFSVFLEQVWADMNGDFTWLIVQLLSNYHLSQFSSNAHITEYKQSDTSLMDEDAEMGIWYTLSETKWNFMNLLC